MPAHATTSSIVSASTFVAPVGLDLRFAGLAEIIADAAGRAGLLLGPGQAAIAVLIDRPARHLIADDIVKGVLRYAVQIGHFGQTPSGFSQRAWRQGFTPGFF